MLERPAVLGIVEIVELYSEGSSKARCFKLRAEGHPDTANWTLGVENFRSLVR